MIISLNETFQTSKHWEEIKQKINKKEEDHLRSFTPDEPLSEVEKPDDFIWSNKDFQKEKLKFKYALESYKKEIETLKKAAFEQNLKSVQVRKDYLREVQMLRESLACCGATKEKELIAKYK